MGIHSAALQVGFGADQEEGSRLGQGVESGEVQISPIHDVEGAGFPGNHVEGVDFVEFSVGDVNERRDAAAQIQKRMEFDRALRLPEVRPGKHGEAQIDRGRIESIDGLVQLYGKPLAAVQPACFRNQGVSQIGVNAPVSLLVGIGDCRTRYLAADTHVVQLLLLGSEARFDVSQTFPVGELRECHAEILIEAGKTLYLEVALVPCHALPKGADRHEVHNLRENEFASIHGVVPPSSRKNDAPSAMQISSRVHA